MLMDAGTRKLALSIHVTASVGLLGAIASFLALALIGLTTLDADTVRAAFLGTQLTAWYVVTPLALGALATGLIEALGTRWGLFRHYWVAAKLALTVFAVVILLIKLRLINQTAGLALTVDAADPALRFAGLQLAVHAAGGLVVLTVPVVLSIYKPGGLIKGSQAT